MVSYLIRQGCLSRCGQTPFHILKSIHHPGLPKRSISRRFLWRIPRVTWKRPIHQLVIPRRNVEMPADIAILLRRCLIHWQSVALNFYANVTGSVTDGVSVKWSVRNVPCKGEERQGVLSYLPHIVCIV